MCHFHVLAWATLLLSVAQADRITVDRITVALHDHQLGPSKDESAAVTVCEDDTILEKVMASPDVDGIRAIPWKDISDSMTNSLSNEALLISNLESEVQKLNKEIERKKTAEVSTTLTGEQIQTLITGSISTEDSFGSVENAKTSKCGKPGNKPRVPYESSIVATERIVSLAQPLLSTGDFKSEIKKFVPVCKIFLGAEKSDELENYCGQVCVDLAKVVQGLSDQTSNSKMDTTKLEKTLAAKNIELLDAQKRRGQCQQSKQNIEGFRQYLESLDAEIIKRHEAVRKAEIELDSAYWALDDLEKKLGEQNLLLSDAETLLQGNKETVKEAREALAGLQGDEEKFIELIGAAKSNLEELREELANMKSAANAVLEIKKYVSATTLKMGYYVDMAVRKPVRDIGLAEATNVWDYFKQDVTAEQCSLSFKEKLSDFHQYCTGPAMEAFEKIKHFVNLTPLCTLDEESKIASEGDAAVQKRIGLLTKDMQDTQSWLDPFKGVTDMTVEKEKEKVELGEPEGLRQVMGVYGKTKFYTTYLKHWKVRKGKFLKLLDQLTASMASLEGDVLNEEKLLKELKDALDKTTTNREAAQTKLDVALADEQAAISGKEEVEQAMASLDTKILEATNLVTDLEQALNQAILMYKEAKATLISEHAAKQDGIMALSQLQGLTVGTPLPPTPPP